MISPLNIAICVIAYNRTDCLAKVLYSLTKANYSFPVTLIISIDKSNTDIVEKYANNFVWEHGPKIVRVQNANLGLKKHVLKCGGYSKDYDALVVLEDDITVSPYFFDYVVQCFDKYKDDDRIAGFSLYNFPRAYVTLLPFNPVKSEFDIFMMNCAMSWGQVWTHEKWQKFIEWYEENSGEFDLPYLPYNINHWGNKSWLKYHTRYCIEKNKYFIYPYQSLSTNSDDQGTHNKNRKTTIIQSQICCLSKTRWNLPSFDECFVKYDGFFEPKFLHSYLGVEEDELCVDFYGNKSGIQKRYRLTRDSLPFKIIKGFSLEYKPFEANVIFDEKGNDFFLYDLNEASTYPQKMGRISYLEYHFLNAFEIITICDMMSILFGRFVRKSYRIIAKLKKIV